MRDIKLLTPVAQELLAKFSYNMTMAGLNFIVTSTLRTLTEQEALYAQGRESRQTINAIRERAGMPPLSLVESKKVVTWTMESRHLTGRAFDIALVYPSTKTIYWGEKISVNIDKTPDYLEAAKIGQKVGLIAGGFWDTPDWPHFESPE